MSSLGDREDDCSRVRSDPYRWIPFRTEDLAAHAKLDNRTSPSPQALAEAPPPFNEWLGMPQLPSIASELAFMRNKTVVSVGDR